MSRDEAYTDITCYLEEVRKLAIRVSGDEWEKDKWIPRSLINGGFETQLDDMEADGQEVIVPVMQWFARKENLL